MSEPRCPHGKTINEPCFACVDMNRGHTRHAQWAKVGPELLKELIKARDLLKEVQEDCYGLSHIPQSVDDIIAKAKEIE